jgi:DNA-nicking Smr family endonuclease
LNPDPAAVTVPIEREIDLHCFAPRDIPSVVDEYITAAAERGLTEVRLVHGRGRGVQRACRPLLNATRE